MPAVKRRRASEAVLPGATGELERGHRLALAAERLALLEVGRMCEQRAPFVEFAEKALDLKLTEAQRAVAAFLFDGAKPSPAYREKVFGGCTEAAPFSAQRTALVVCGRGSGKTRVMIAARAIHLALMADLSGLALGESGLIPLVAPEQRAGRHSLSFIKGFFLASPILARLLKVESTQESLKLTRPDGRRVNIEVRPASAGGSAVRGQSLAGVMLDEAAFFYGEGYEVSDVEIYRAAVPRMLPGSQIVLATTPWAQSGLVWELFRDNFGKPKTAVCARAPTLIMRPSAETLRDYENALVSDPDNASREFDAEFLSADAERFFPEAVIEKIVDASVVVPGTIATGETIRFGADFAFASDSSALVGFVEREGQAVMSSLMEQRPAPNAPLVPSQVVKAFAEEVNRCGAKLVIADGHYREAIQEHLISYGLALVDAPSPPAASFVVARAMMSQGLVKIPPHHRLLAQLRRVRSTQKPGGIVTIHQPRAKDGGHGDIVSALVCALSGITITSKRPESEPKSYLEKAHKAELLAQKERLEKNAKAQGQKDKRMLGWLKRTVGPGGWRNLTK